MYINIASVYNVVDTSPFSIYKFTVNITPKTTLLYII